MSDIINLLPDSVANQIAAGEVIQRPASVVKELVENAIDAGAQNIQVHIKDGGNTLIQVVDDGVGMSETDARMSFERHATSKIKEADDLFALYTKGFRGEALASIAAVAQVELYTRQEADELGVFIEMAGTRLFRQDRVQTDQGTNILVKNLFFNVPARRRFLKSHSTEMMHVRNEFYRIVLVHPDISFSLQDDNTELFNLPAGSLKARIESIFGKRMDQQLLPIESSTELITIKGYVGRPEFAQKKAHQYFFVNNRYMRHPYFHKAVMLAYEKLIKPGEYPSYFIYLEADAKTIDVNVHPSKTEIKFENEPVIFSILSATVKESLGKFQVIPAIDFDQSDSPSIPVFDDDKPIVAPQVSFNPDYNPFSGSKGGGSAGKRSGGSSYDWEKLYAGFQHTKPDKESVIIDFESDRAGKKKGEAAEHFTDGLGGVLQIKGRYLLSSIPEGLLLIDQHRAHFRVLFDRLMLIIQNQKGVSQQILFPEILELTANEDAMMVKILPELEWLGFDIESFGPRSYSINGVPSELPGSATISLLKELVGEMTDARQTAKEIIREQIAALFSRRAAIQYGQVLDLCEAEQLIRDLFSCSNHSFAPDGKPIIVQIEMDELERRFN